MMIKVMMMIAMMVMDDDDNDGDDDVDDDDDDRIRKTRAGCDGALSRSREGLSLFPLSQGRRKVRG